MRDPKRLFACIVMVIVATLMIMVVIMPSIEEAVGVRALAFTEMLCITCLWGLWLVE